VRDQVHAHTKQLSFIQFPGMTYLDYHTYGTLESRFKVVFLFMELRWSVLWWKSCLPARPTFYPPLT